MEQTWTEKLADLLAAVERELSGAPDMAGRAAEFDDMPEMKYHGVTDHIYDALSSIQHARYELTGEREPAL